MVKERDHTRMYIKGTEEGFAAKERKNGTCMVEVPIRFEGIGMSEIRSILGDYELKFSDSYKLYYIEKTTVSFVERKEKKWQRR